MSLNRHELFPTVLSGSMQKDLANQMLPLAKQYLSAGTYDANKLDYKNIYIAGPNIKHDNNLTPFIDFILKAGAEHLESLQYDSASIKLNPQIYVGEMLENDFHNFHSHPGSILSGILYLQVPEGSAPIVFRDPRPFRSFINLPTKQSTSDVFLQPSEGLFLIWESWLGHEVPKNLSKEARITMVFNLGV